MACSARQFVASSAGCLEKSKDFAQVPVQESGEAFVVRIAFGAAFDFVQIILKPHRFGLRQCERDFPGVARIAAAMGASIRQRRA